VQPWLESPCPFTETLHKTLGSLANFLVGIGAAATAAGHPRSETSRFISAELQDGLVAGGGLVVLLELLVDPVLLTHGVGDELNNKMVGFNELIQV
jgi:hypothetical protein